MHPCTLKLNPKPAHNSKPKTLTNRTPSKWWTYWTAYLSRWISNPVSQILNPAPWTLTRAPWAVDRTMHQTR